MCLKTKQENARTISESRSASGNEIRRPPYLKRIWPFVAASEMKTPWPAWRIVDLRISQAAKKWSSLFLNFLESLTGNRERRNWFPAGDQSNGMAVKRDLRINFRPIGCSALIMRWFCRKTQEKHKNKFLNGYYCGVTNELNLVHDIIPTDWNEKPCIQNPIHISKRKEILSRADCYIRRMCNSKQIK